MKAPHAQRAADSTADQRKQKQRFFRNAPFLMSGTALVDAHEAECDAADQEHPAEYQFESNSGHDLRFCRSCRERCASSASMTD